MLKKVSFLVIAALFIVGLSSFDSKTALPIKDWTHLGTKKVNFKLDRDVINVGVNDGRFSKLKLVVTGGSLNMHRMVVKYANGSQEEIELRHNFSRRSGSRVIDLKGQKRFIKQIVLVYDTKNYSTKRAKLRVFGRR